MEKCSFTQADIHESHCYCVNFISASIQYNFYWLDLEKFKLEQIKMEFDMILWHSEKRKKLFLIFRSSYPHK